MGVEEGAVRSSVRHEVALAPRQALEGLVRDALQRPPCLVSFSGGRDSSLVLAVATHVARREGLPLPVPYTRCFPSAEASDEREWQELVVRHLGLEDWQVVRFHNELDLIGPVARRLLRQHGLVFPVLLYVLGETFESAVGGSHLTGEGGDEVLGSRRATFARYALTSARWLARPREVKGIFRHVAPRPLRRALLEQEYRLHPLATWLRPGAAGEVARHLARQRALEPLGWQKSLSWYLATKRVSMFKASTGALASLYDVEHLDPLFDASFVSALGQAGGGLGFASRSDAMAYLVGDLLPAPVIARTTKAAFNNAYFTATAREFAGTWDGRGVDDDLVDVEALRAEWRKPVPSALSFGPLQAAWLASNAQQ